MDEYYLRFPSVFKKALKEGIIEMPQELEIEYAAIKAYRGVRFIKFKKEKLEKQDFLAQIDLKVAGDRRYQQCSDADIDNYGTSVFDDIEELHAAYFLPRKNKGIAEGLVKMENGPICRSDEESHILWFLYEGATPQKDFKVIEYYEKMDNSEEYRTIVL